ncbi:hypothetical protein FACS189445_6750 [Spirochaetia bacterium]|nr:hypothetical protein FACS189445_6750 [Spirochaetia bacterium]
MEHIEYTWSELNDEDITFTFNDVKLTSIAGPEEINGSENFWSPARGDDGKDYDLTWNVNRSNGLEFFVLLEATVAEHSK